ncbi:HMG-Y-related protein A [Rutidosis leptorrhynchoides]|uniref:HMG-Y-related protein A n=1 Tax=Rutidosis leptorrhynchoides TaxID=125765 RepID=UPI003A9958D2
MATQQLTNLPTYSQLIFDAIESLNDKNGVNKTSISRYIEESYGNLPAAHTTLLSHHLNKLKATGQLVFYKNNYFKPDPNAPPRRGRGRPRKFKDSVAPKKDAVVSPPRPRGRPPKPTDPNAPTTETPAVSGRKRGRPPKEGGSVKKAELPVTESGERRGRGRPPKVKAAVATPVGA